MSLNLRYFDDLVLGQNEQLPDVHHLTEAEIMTFAKAWIRSLSISMPGLPVEPSKVSRSASVPSFSFTLTILFWCELADFAKGSDEV